MKTETKIDCFDRTGDWIYGVKPSMLGHGVWRAHRLLENRSPEQIHKLVGFALAKIDLNNAKELVLCREDYVQDILEQNPDADVSAYADWKPRVQPHVPGVLALQRELLEGFDVHLLGSDTEEVFEYEFFAAMAIERAQLCAQELSSGTRFIAEDANEGDRDSGWYFGYEVIELLLSLFRYLDHATNIAEVGELAFSLQTKDAIQKAIEASSRSSKTMQDLIGNVRSSALEDSKRERKKQSKKNNAIRHQGNHAAKAFVHEQFSKEPRRFSSGEQAARHYVVELAKHGWHFSQRAVGDWVRAYAKANGIRFR